MPNKNDCYPQLLLLDLTNKRYYNKKYYTFFNVSILL